MKKTAIFVLTLICYQFAFSQSTKVTSIINFSGTVGKYPIEMQLSLVNLSDSIFGSYYYLKSGSENKIFVAGTFENGNLMLQERSLNQKKRDYESTGYFKISSLKNKTIIGTWGKNKTAANKQEALPVKLTCREDLTTFDPFKFRYTIQKKKADYENISKVASTYFNILSLSISVDEKVRWKIAGFDAYDLVDEQSEVELQDMNFDGYLDLKIPIYYPDMAKGDYGYHYYLYNPQASVFQRSQSLRDLGVVFFDARLKMITNYEADGRGNESTSSYKWQSGKLYLVKKLQTYEDDELTHYSEYQIINGKSVQTKSYKRK